VLEIATHRHGLRYEYYITNYLCSELVAFAVLLIHYWTAEIHRRTEEKKIASELGSTLSTRVSPSNSTNSRLSPRSRVAKQQPVGSTASERKPSVYSGASEEDETPAPMGNSSDWWELAEIDL
jgi:hypothetical protein